MQKKRFEDILKTFIFERDLQKAVAIGFKLYFIIQ